ncbi:MAG: cell division protein FtsW [Bacteroidetes bacterium]|nr:cell division protein FtsW [Bacteroidota bacterium]
MLRYIRNIQGDKVIWGIVIILSVLSLLTVYSATGSLAYAKNDGNTEYYLIKQLIVVVAGLLFMYLIHLVKYTWYSKGYIIFVTFLLSIGFLAALIIYGLTINSAARWLPIPLTGLTFQPSDLAKPALVMFLAKLLANNQDKIKSLKIYLFMLIPIILICLLIFPSNFSTAAILFVSCLVLIWIARARMAHIGLTILAGAAFGVILFFLIMHYPKAIPRGETWKHRIEVWLDDSKADPEADYQITQAKIAIASGGFFGKTPGKSTQRNFLPHPYSDFIFAFIIEEYGLVGGGFVTLLYLTLFFRIVRIANRCKGNFGSFLSFGIGFLIVFQALINMGVAVGLLPVTGQTLPLVSMGGTSLWFTAISIGIILSVSRGLEIEAQEEKTSFKISDNLYATV